MRDTSARLLALLSLLQSRPDRSGPELAERLGVSVRTVRNDVARLRGLGYPVDATLGAAGHYRLGVGASLPPLLLDDAEAVAVAVGLRAGTGVAGIEESSRQALTKLEQVLPHRLRRTVAALGEATDRAPDVTDSNVADPEVDPDVLTAVAAAIRDREVLRYADDDAAAPGPAAAVEPYRLVSWARRWYLVARDPRRDRWGVLRVDRMTLRPPHGPRFVPTSLPGGDHVAFVLREVASTGWSVHARITVAASAAEVLARINPTVGVVEAIDERTCVLVTGADSFEMIAVYVGMLGLDFGVTGPPELVEHLRTLGHRYLRALPGGAPA